MNNRVCPACGAADIRVFYRHRRAPVHSVLIHHTRQEALDLATGQIELGFCESCGFIYNTTFDSRLQDYSLEYESTQGYSGTFNAFADQLAAKLIERYDLHGKTVIEIGSGQGEFLQAICRQGGNRGLGFDPAFQPERDAHDQNVAFIKDYYSEKYAHMPADFIVCKMTLEHIRPVHDFVSTVRRAIDAHPNPIVFFQIPEVTRILQEVAFWDVYYEHCSYFSPASLSRLFHASGFEILNLEHGYDGQYLMIEARPTGQDPAQPAFTENPGELAGMVERFASLAPQRIHAWGQYLAQVHAAGQQVALWGGGSKAVAFLTTLAEHFTEDNPPVACAVDINPYKHGTFMAGTATPVVAPEQLVELKPELVIIMNPIYQPEIHTRLSQLGLSPTIRAITETPAI